MQVNLTKLATQFIEYVDVDAAVRPGGGGRNFW